MVQIKVEIWIVAVCKDDKPYSVVPYTSEEEAHKECRQLRESFPDDNPNFVQVFPHYIHYKS